MRPLYDIRFAIVPFLLITACGPLDQQTTPREIKDGTPASEFAASCLVDMYDAQNKLVALCSGAVIALNVILIAGHCVAGFDHHKIICPYLNNLTVNGIGEPHPNYHINGHGLAADVDDIGLIYLSLAVPME